MKELRPRQESAFENVRESFRQGLRRIVLQAPCGFGKTTMGAAFIHACLAKGTSAAFFVPRITLVDQTYRSFYDDGLTDVGVFQANHPNEDHSKPVQICSVDTCRSRNVWPDKSKLWIIDECHMRKAALMDRLLETGKHAVGLTATPWAKGMAKVRETPRGPEAEWETLLKAATMAELIDEEWASPFKYFGVGYPDLKGIKTSVSTYGKDYNQEQLSDRMNTNELHADIIRTYKQHWGKGKTLFFGVDCLHAKTMQKRFNEAGIPAGYQDAHTPDFGHYAEKDHKDGLWKKGDYIEGRSDIARKFASGEYQVVCNVETLTTGVDWDVRCISLGRPTKSETLLVQICGRGSRLAEGKDCCVVLDHTGTISDDALGYPHLIDHDHLDGGEQKPKADVKPKQPSPRPCPKCCFLKLPRVLTCPNCGHTPEIMSHIHEHDGELVEIKPGQLTKKSGKNPTWTTAEKMVFYRELKGYAEIRSFAKGWAFVNYMKRFDGEKPPLSWNKLAPADVVSPSTALWIRGQNQRYFIAKKNARSVESRAGG
jgi:DNA repair protein RadD